MLADERYPANLVVTKEDFLQSGWKDAISGLERENHTSRCSALSAAEKRAFDDDRLSRGKVLFTLGKALFILKNACSGRELPEDVTEAEIAFFAEIVDEVDDPWLKAHLAHLVWHYQRPRNIKFALDAIDSYRSIPLDDETWLWADEFWDRAIRLSISIKDSYRLSAIEEAIIQTFESATCEGRYFGRELAKLLKSNKLGKNQATAIATKLKSMALGFESDNEYSVAADYYQAAAQWFKSSGDTTKFVEMILRKVESLVKKGDSRLSSEEPSCLLAALSYGVAIDTLYWLKDKSKMPKAELSTYQVDERIDELMLRREDLLKQGIGEMETTTFNIPGEFNQFSEVACAAVTGKDHIEALKKFVNLRSIVDVDELTSHTVNELRNSVASSIFSTTTISADGRVTSNHPPISANPSSDDPAVRAQVEEDYMLDVEFFAKAALLPALKVIRQEHCLEPELFSSIVEHSPVVPPGRKQAFVKGLLAGYNGDFDVAFQVLSPQIEHLIRSQLKKYGVNTRKRKNGIDEELTLGPLLYHEKTEEIFGKDLLFELKTLFHNRRNDQAHGLIDDTSSPSHYDVYIWWLLLRLVFSSSNFQSEKESPNA